MDHSHEIHGKVLFFPLFFFARHERIGHLRMRLLSFDTEKTDGMTFDGQGWPSASHIL